MDIIINSSTNKNFYDEVEYARRVFEKIHTNPLTKIQRQTKVYNRIYIIFSILMLISFNAWAKDNISNTTFAIYTTIFVINIFFITFKLYEYKKSLNNLTKKVGHAKLHVDENKISYEKDGELSFKLEYKWDTVKYIIVNKYSIFILPQNKTDAFIALDIENKDKLIEALKKYNHEDLIVKNSQMNKKNENNNTI